MIFLRMAGLTGSVAEHWDRTIINRINIEQIRKFLTKRQYSSLKSIGENLNFWGDPDRLHSRSERITENSKVIFYGQKKHHTYAEVPYVFINSELSNYLWPCIKEDDLLYQNMYVINNIQKINIPFVSQDYKKKDGTNYSPNADRFMAGGILKDFKDFKYNDPHKGTIWYSNNKIRAIDNELFLNVRSEEEDSHNQKGLSRSTPIQKAWIYKITFSYLETKMVYIGQDILCKENYLSSSLIFWHIRKMLNLLEASEEELKKQLNYNKEILHEITDTTKGYVNDIESECIEDVYRLSEVMDYIPINYTGSNSPSYR